MTLKEKGQEIDQLELVLTVEDIQRVLRISRAKAYELAHTNDFPTIRIGRAIRIPRDAFRRWLDAPEHQEIQGW